MYKGFHAHKSRKDIEGIGISPHAIQEKKRRKERNPNETLF